MAKNIHELKKNLAGYKANRHFWYTALSDREAPFMLRNSAFARVRELDKQIQNLELTIAMENRNGL
jgi:hypothetical protein